MPVIVAPVGEVYETTPEGSIRTVPVAELWLNVLITPDVLVLMSNVVVNE